MSDTFASTSILTELARRSYFDPRRKQPIRDDTVIKLLDADPVRRLPGSTKRDTGFLASYENDEGTFLMMGIAIPIEDPADSTAHVFPVVNGWYVSVMESGGIPIEGFQPTPPQLVMRGCLRMDDHVMANGFFDMTGTAKHITAKYNGQLQFQDFENRAAVLCCEFAPTADNRLSGELSVIDQTGNDVYREPLDVSLEIPDWIDGDACARKEPKP